MERYINKDKKRTGRKGMDLWVIFVLSRVRLTLNASYEFVYNLANNHKAIRWVMGIETESGFPRQELAEDKKLAVRVKRPDAGIG